MLNHLQDTIPNSINGWPFKSIFWKCFSIDTNYFTTINWSLRNRMILQLTKNFQMYYFILKLTKMLWSRCVIPFFKWDYVKWLYQIQTVISKRSGIYGEFFWPLVQDYFHSSVPLLSVKLIRSFNSRCLVLCSELWHRSEEEILWT